MMSPEGITPERAIVSVLVPDSYSGHPMKPTRIRMCHSLVMNYGLYKKMEIFVSLLSLGSIARTWLMELSS